MSKLSRQEFETWVEPDANDCWIWLGSRLNGGYGQHGQELVHRVAYRLYLGELLPGYEVHHVCEVRLCCNPEHLEQVPKNVHRLLNNGWTQDNGVWYCSKGHEMTGHNIQQLHQNITCRKCRADNQRRYRDR